MEYKLSELFDLQMGKTPSRDSFEYWSSPDFPWISIGDLSNSGKYILETKEKISERAKSESGIKAIPADTVVMSFKLSIGKVAITPMEMYSNEAIMAFVDKGVAEIIPDYLYYLLLSKEWDAGTNKAVMGKTLNKATLSDTIINIHPVNEQRHIISYLDKIVSVIDIYNRQLAELGKLVKARFIEMFGGSNENPFHFRIANICDISDALFAGGDKPTDLADKRDEKHPYPVFANGELHNGLQGYSSKCRVDKPALTISARGTVGFCCLRDAGFTPIVRLITIVPKEHVNLVYLKCAIESITFRHT